MRLSDEIIERIEKWGAEQDDKPERSEAIRRLLELGLSVTDSPKPKKVRS